MFKVIINGKERFMEIPADADDTQKLLESSLYGGLDGPIVRNGIWLKGITRTIRTRYGGGHHRIKTRYERSNKELGTRIHRELYDWIETKISKKRTNRKSSHSWTLQAIDLLISSGLNLVKAEVPVAYGSLGTRVDIIAKSSLTPKEAIFISIKTGIRRGPDGTRGRRIRRMPPPFTDLQRCERLQDEIQVMSEIALARKGHGVSPTRSYILEVPEGVMREVPKWTMDIKKQDILLTDLNRY